MAAAPSNQQWRLAAARIVSEISELGVKRVSGRKQSQWRSMALAAIMAKSYQWQQNNVGGIE